LNMEQAKKKEWVDWQNTKVLQKAVVVDEEGNILVIKRTEEGPASRKGKWDLPGGSMGPTDLKEGAPHEAAIRREVEEETGLRVEEVRPVYVGSWFFERSVGKVLGVAIGYICMVGGIMPEPKLSPEHVDQYWGKKEEILQMDFGDDGGLHLAIIKLV